MEQRCGVENCDRTYFQKGFCHTHYRQFAEREKCSIDNCDKFVEAKNLCQNHYAIMIRNGHPLRRQRTSPGDGTIDKSGYLVVMINGKNTRAHRNVMEQHIGRKLKRNEVVHHINSDRIDNRIENLCLMTRSEHDKLHGKKKTSDKITDTYKWCNTCKKMLPHNMFFKDKRGTLQLSCYCKVCTCNDRKIKRAIKKQKSYLSFV